MKKNFKFFWYQEGFLNTNTYKYRNIQILSDTTLTMLERIMCLAIILLSVKYRFQNHLPDCKYNAKERTIN